MKLVIATLVWNIIVIAWLLRPKPNFDQQFAEHANTGESVMITFDRPITDPLYVIHDCETKKWTWKLEKRVAP